MRIRVQSFVIALSLCALFIKVQSSWWSFAMVPPKSFRSVRQTRRVCQRLAGLSRFQRSVCRQRPDLMMAVSRGAKQAVKQCGRLFANHQWNCSLVERSPTLFGRLTLKSHKETAFLYALFSAALVHSVTKACTKGQVHNCYCHRKRISKTWSSSSSDWTVCHDDVRDGVRFSKVFLDRSERSDQNPRNLMNLHNIDVGRRAVMGSMRKECKCHGVSGSCSMQTCRSSLSNFHLVAKLLKRKYDSARLISPSKRSFLAGKISSKAIKRSVRHDLVYMHFSPDYCSPDSKLDILGTAKRSCHPSEVAVNSCDVICCGRGYDTFEKDLDYRCQCKFNWCCYVTCKTCKSFYEEYTCKE